MIAGNLVVILCRTRVAMRDFARVRVERGKGGRQHEREREKEGGQDQCYVTATRSRRTYDTTSCNV